jgi:hypothetical protein
MSIRPELLRWIRGLDLCNIEASQPLWVTRLILEDARGFLQPIAARTRLPPVRTTIHVGEDWVRMVDGYRRTHELFEFGLLQAGDRIGHGTVLGTGPKAWASQSSWLVQRREDRLDDLLWELARYQAGDLDAPRSRLAIVEHEAHQVGRTIFGSLWDVEAGLKARELRHSTCELRRIGFQANREVPPDSNESAARKLLRAYLTSKGAKRAGEEPIPVWTHPSETEFLLQAREWLHRVLGQWEITIEANPSSNLVISAFPKLEEHPLFRLAPLDPAERAFSVSINTDNPLVFGTCVADEFAYLYHAMLRNGVPSSRALAWLERVRGAGWRSRFTFPPGPSHSPGVCGD